MNRGQFAVLAALVLFVKNANEDYVSAEKRGGIEALVADLVEILDLDVDVESNGFADSSIKGISSATKSRALSDLKELGIIKEAYRGRYELTDEFDPENMIHELGDSDE